jgi:O-acetyl-ADP-ribose deacetylase (regulator of RNase III)
MIEFTKGDMFETEADIRVNTVNCVGAMGAGVALAFKRRYPEMFKVYQEDCKSGKVRPGEMHIWRSLAGDWIINFPTKRDWRDPSRYEDIESGLIALRKYLSQQGAVSVALPALGCGNGGLDWARVSVMIEEQLGVLDAHIKVFPPASSRGVEDSALALLTDDEILSVKRFGFDVVSEQLRKDFRASSDIFYKGKSSLLNQKWIALIPSREPSERELNAIAGTASAIAHARSGVVIALLLNNRSSEDLAQVLHKNGVNALLVLPFGVLTRRSVTKSDSRSSDGIAYISSAPPTDKWSSKNFSGAMALLLDRAFVSIITDPSPGWLAGKNGQSWRRGPLFYLNYGQMPPDVHKTLSEINAIPISKEAHSGRPKIDAIFDLPN